jgi:molybdate transport system substrate-binding protein
MVIAPDPNLPPPGLRDLIGHYPRKKQAQLVFRIVSCLFLLSSLAACAAPPAESSSSVEITVAAAADLQFAFTEIGVLFEQETGQKVRFVFGSTGLLAQQIMNGAPFDLFAAANISFVDTLVQEDRILPDTVAVYARGRIVLAVNRSANVSAASLEALLSDQITHVAIANPEHAPYGMAAREALEAAGIWKEVQPKIVYGENVRQALQFIQTGDAQVGIIALSIAQAPEISWTLLDEALHNPLDQALGVVSGSPHPEAARAFAAFINGPSGRPIMQRYGFLLPGEDITAPAP